MAAILIIVIFQAEIQKILCFQLIKYNDLLLFCVSHYNKQNMFWFWTVNPTKLPISRCHLWLWETVGGLVFHCFLTFYRLNDESLNQYNNLQYLLVVTTLSVIEGYLIFNIFLIERPKPTMCYVICPSNLLTSCLCFSAPRSLVPIGDVHL